MRDIAIEAGPLTIPGHGGDEITAYLAQPKDGPPAGGVLVIHHMPGWDRGTKEFVRTFATWGYAAICPNLHHRDAPGAEPDDAAAAARAAGGVPDDRFLGDAAGAIEHLRALPSSNGKAGAIGHCSGGRQAILAAARLPLDAAVDCYGAFVLQQPAADWARNWPPLRDLLPDVGAPLLGLFGNDDQNPTPAEVDELDAILTEHGREHEFHRWDGAGHAFFSVDRPSYRQQPAVEGWQRIREFFAKHLS